MSADPFSAPTAHVSGINNHGAAVGGYCQRSCNSQAGVHGFLYENGKFQRIDFPLPNATTTANGINDLGQIVGGYCPGFPACPEGQFSPSHYGFLYDHGDIVGLQTLRLGCRNFKGLPIRSTPPASHR